MCERGREGERERERERGRVCSSSSPSSGVRSTSDSPATTNGGRGQASVGSTSTQWPLGEYILMRGDRVVVVDSPATTTRSPPLRMYPPSSGVRSTSDSPATTTQAPRLSIYAGHWAKPVSAVILGTGGPECDPKGNMACLQNQFRCPPMLGARRT